MTSNIFHKPKYTIFAAFWLLICLLKLNNDGIKKIVSKDS